MLSLELLSGAGFMHCRDHFSFSFFLLKFFILTIIWDGRISNVLQSPIALHTWCRKWRGRGQEEREKRGHTGLTCSPVLPLQTVCLIGLSQGSTEGTNKQSHYSKLVRNWILMFCQSHGTIKLTNKCTLQSNWILTFLPTAWDDQTH